MPAEGDDFAKGRKATLQFPSYLAVLAQQQNLHIVFFRRDTDIVQERSLSSRARKGRSTRLLEFGGLSTLFVLRSF